MAHFNNMPDPNSEFNLSLRPFINHDIDFGFGDDPPLLDPQLLDQFDPNTLVHDDQPAHLRPYHPKRPHKKSRAGCFNCKKRKVKCSEERPTCRACSLRKETCSWPTRTKISDADQAAAADPQPASAPAPANASSPEPISSRAMLAACRDGSPDVIDIDPSQIMYKEPVFLPGQLSDALDMKMLWFWTTETYGCLSVESDRSPLVSTALQIKIPEHAFASGFLMQCVMGLSALQMTHRKQYVPPNRVAAYRANAFEGYRKAIEAARPNDYPALLASSLLMCVLASETFRDPSNQRLYVVDWIQVWRGIGLIVDIISPRSIAESGLAVLFYRPPVDLEKTMAHIPNNLLFMISSIKTDDDDFQHQQTYYDTLRCLGSLYMELSEAGLSPIMDLRAITWATFLPQEFISIAREGRPRALIILAHYLCFVKLNRNAWWMQGITDPELDKLSAMLSKDWEQLMRIPMKVRGLEATNKVGIAKAILDNLAWTPGEEDLYEKWRRSKMTLPLALRDNNGREAEIVDGKWKYKPTTLQAQGLFWKKLEQGDATATEHLPSKDTLLAHDTETPPSADGHSVSSGSPGTTGGSPAASSPSAHSQMSYSPSLPPPPPGQTPSAHYSGKMTPNWRVLVETRQSMWESLPDE